jgi:acyl-CoA thioesterase-1
VHARGAAAEGQVDIVEEDDGINHAVRAFTTLPVPAYGSNMNKLKMLIVAASLLGVLEAPIAAAAPVEIVALGDSLTAGLGVEPGESFPEQLEAALRARGHDVTVANAGVSGDTASDGLARVEWSVPPEADIVIVALGANDALRGIDPAVTREALSKIIATLSGRGQRVLLAGMLAPRNLDDTYARAFDRIYPELAKEYGVALHPFFLAGVATEPSLNQPDGMHPNAAGVAKMVEAMLPQVEELVAAAAAAD